MGTKYSHHHGSSSSSVLSLYYTITLSLLPILSLSLDTITPTQPLTSNQTIVSAAAAFELGFFSPNNSDYWYLGIWYNQIPTKTIVWVANRDNPLTNSSSATLKINQDGNLVLADYSSQQNPIWSTNFKAASSNTVAQLLDDGNLVVRIENDDDPANYLYQSFDHPTDTLLPGMKLGWDSKTGLNRMLTSWKGTDDPSTGAYSFEMDVSGLPGIYLWNGKVIDYRSGPWNGLRFSGVPEMNTSDVLTFSFVTDANEVTYSFGVTDKSLYSRLIVNSSGVLQRYTWIETSRVWNLFWYAPDDQCDNYKECGVFGVCDTNNSPVCECLNGFEPRNQQAWDLRDGSEGCVRVSGLECHSDGFLRLEDMKLPESSTAFVDRSMGRGECEKMCRENCSCTAYASADIRGGGSGCVIWSGDLVDMRQYAAAEGGQDLFVRVSAADSRSVGSKTKAVKTGKIVGIMVGGVVLLLGLFILWKKKRKQRVLKEQTDHRGSHERSTQSQLLSEGVRVSKRDFSGERSTTDDLELPLFDFSTMAMATDNFCHENKLGQGGFGIVYKGLLVEGQEIAVKRLSKNSGQGVEEFKNEVRLIARLQHRNLVRLLGCCVEIDEKILVYEYMENKSLDSVLFNKERCSLLDWQRRFNIICGIGRGLLYLHQDSRFRIIHRDLKASNILLDREMNPKISDFGMARIFGGDQTEADTMRVVGTYGYMAPEYAMDGHFSVKSDVFSFGVLVLEIVTGKKNRGFYSPNQQINLLGHAWRLWREGKGLELLDPSVGKLYIAAEVLRCIQVGLLCVQERAEDRPTMSSVVLMLSSESASLSQPKNPGFCMLRHHGETDSSSSRQDESCTLNHVTVTILDGR
ncbi:receptor-like serine/threonine-protein kinase SD1-8 [Rhododendron vialii]|uniref:receptor-like serine/threonine-protein kinase SD1-8 n=1 Tax=Rhododendron vialii TaxID=182163 RepID=UPI00266009B3|nr:receptor-like serine/threonine-protein kinase SD1-8 [Rhododendron vialii]